MKMGRIFGGSGLGRNRDRRRNHVAVGRHVPVLPPPEDAAFALEPWWRRPSSPPLPLSANERCIGVTATSHSIRTPRGEAVGGRAALQIAGSDRDLRAADEAPGRHEATRFVGGNLAPQ
jgi:hypothetical protein